MNINNLMNDPYAWLFLSFCTVAAFVFAIYTWVKSKRKKEFTYISDSYKIIQIGKETIPKLKLTYDNKIVDNVIITKYAIWNSGNTIIEACDILNEKPLKLLSTNRNTTILDIKIIAESDATNKFRIVDIKENCAVISFDFINPKDGIVIQVIHTGEASFIEINCRIKENKKSVKTVGKIPDILHSIYVILPAIMAVLLGMSLPSLFNPLNFSEYDNTILKEISTFSIILNIILIIIYFNLIKRYRLNLPLSLRKYINWNNSI